MTKKEKDAEKFAKNTVELEQLLGRDLRPDEVMLLALFASVVNASEEDEKDAENKAFHINGRHMLMIFDSLAIAEAALEICGIDLKKKEDKND